MQESARFFRAAGYVFTYDASPLRRTTRLDMWREDPATGDRYWVTTARCTRGRQGAYAAALALVAWIRSLEVPSRGTIQAVAVAESLAVMRDRVQSAAPRRNPAVALALHQLRSGRVAAA